MSIGKTIDTLLELKASGAETASTNGATKTVGPTDIVKVLIKVTAVSGTTPTLDLKIQDGDSDPPTADRVKLPQITAVGEYEAFFRTTKKYVRYASTIAGTTPSFTYSVYVTA